MNFAEVLASSREGTFVVPEGWHQGRTAYGGFSSALALAEAMRVGGELPPLRSTQIAMIAPLFGEVRVSARIMRQGRNATWVAAEIASDKGVGTSANFVFMHPVESTVALVDVPPPSDLIAVQDARPSQTRMRRPFCATTSRCASPGHAPRHASPTCAGGCGTRTLRVSTPPSPCC